MAVVGHELLGDPFSVHFISQRPQGIARHIGGDHPPRGKGDSRRLAEAADPSVPMRARDLRFLGAAEEERGPNGCLGRIPTVLFGVFDQVFVRKPAEVLGRGGITHLHGDRALAVQVGGIRRRGAVGAIRRLVMVWRRSLGRRLGVRADRILRPSREFVGVFLDVMHRALHLI